MSTGPYAAKPERARPSTQGSKLDPDSCYRAILARDARFDGRFFTAVRTTGIYCRPVCPSPPPKRDNCAWYPSAAAAQAAGFRPCIRCRPELAPGPGWDGAAATVRRAISLITDGLAAEDTLDVPHLATCVGVNERKLRRLFARHVGASPKQVLVAQRMLFAKALVVDSTLSMAQIAFASGHGSVRRFNTAFRAMFGRPPSALRRAHTPATTGSNADTMPATLLRLPYRTPFRWADFLSFLAPRAIPGVEAVMDGAWRRTVRIAEAAGTVEVEDDPASGTLMARVALCDLAQLAAVRSRLERVFDLDADPARIDPVLALDPMLAGDIASRPGVRVPGAWDGFEMAVRAVLGQQVSVAGARTLAGRIAERWGTALAAAAVDTPLRVLFPAPADLADADLASVGVMPARARTIRGLAQALLAEPDLLSPHGGPSAEVMRRLRELPGIGPWTAQYVAMRALHDPDAFPAGDLGLRRALGGRDMTAATERWRPWRAYAAVRLWTLDAAIATQRAASRADPDGPSATALPA